MLNKIRNFSKTIFAKILLVIVVIPFVFWGMGGVFNSGNKNSIAKVNDANISSQEFIEFLNNSKIDQNVIAANLENNILEELLRQFISIKILEFEINDLNIMVSDKNLASEIKLNKAFLNDKNIFSRVKYEKFLLTNNLTASTYERSLKERMLQQKLFSYIGAGIISPKFLTKNKYYQDTKEINIELIDLKNLYKTKKSFTEFEINEYINKNIDSLEKDYINFSYSKITPKDLIGVDEFNNDFFDLIDEIENKISNNLNFDEIVNTYKLKIESKNNFLPSQSTDKIEKKIYDLRKQLTPAMTDETDFFLLFKIDLIEKKLPDFSSSIFRDEILQMLYEEYKYQFNKKLITEINNKSFNYTKFKNLVNNNENKIERITLKSISDDKKFDEDSLNIIYSMPINSFVLVSDEKNNVYIVKIISENIPNITKNNQTLSIYNEKSTSDIKREILSTYDQILNTKYEIKINEKTLDRVKNYF